MSRIVSVTEDFADFAGADLPDSHLETIYRKWQQLAKNSEGIPPILDLQPTALEDAADHVALVQLYDDHNTLRPYYIYSGRALNKLYGKLVAGHYLDELFGPIIRQEPMKAYRTIIEQAQPLYSRRMLRSPRKMRGYDRLILPFTDTKKSKDSTYNITHAVLGLVPNDNKTEHRQDWREAEDIKDWIDYLESIENDDDFTE